MIEMNLLWTSHTQSPRLITPQSDPLLTPCSFSHHCLETDELILYRTFYFPFSHYVSNLLTPSFEFSELAESERDLAPGRADEGQWRIGNLELRIGNRELPTGCDPSLGTTPDGHLRQPSQTVGAIVRGWGATELRVPALEEDTLSPSHLQGRPALG